MAEIEETYDFNQHAEHAVWALATAAAASSKHHPRPEDVLVPWTHAASESSSSSSDVCTLEPTPGAGRATLFLRTTLAAVTLANRLNRDFFKYSRLKVKVSPRAIRAKYFFCLFVRVSRTIQQAEQEVQQ